MFLFGLPNAYIVSTALLYMVGFSFDDHATRSNGLFFVPFYNRNYSSA